MSRSDGERGERKKTLQLEVVEGFTWISPRFTVAHISHVANSFPDHINFIGLLLEKEYDDCYREKLKLEARPSKNFQSISITLNKGSNP